MYLSVRPFGEHVLLQMVVRTTKEDRSVRRTQPVVLPVKQKESLSYMNSREFTCIYLFMYGSYIKRWNVLIEGYLASFRWR